MNTTDVILPTLSTYLFQLPLFLVWLAGIILAIMRWQRHPRVSLLVLIALILILIETIINSFLGIWIPLMLSQQGATPGQMGTILAIWRLFASILGAVTWGLVLVAVFGWRDDLIPPTPSR
jgi:hypothetical protein